MTDLAETRRTRGKVLAWSARSRNRMIDTLRSLDYRPLFERGSRPAMVTLTMVGHSEAWGDDTWLQVAPDGEEFKRLIIMLQKRWATSWGERPAGVWKLEFQKRGAPHLHMLVSPPRGRARGTGMEFGLWLAWNWASLQRYEGMTPDEFAKTVERSTSIDYDKGLRGYDAKRVTQYFSKHGVWSAKEYQNQPPKAWVERNKVGQFWGYWRLKKIAGVLFGSAPDFGADGDDADPKSGRRGAEPCSGIADNAHTRQLDARSVAIERHRRRLARATTTHRAEVRVMRHRFDMRTGEVTAYERRSHVRRTYYRPGAGFLVVGDGSVVSGDIARIVAAVSGAGAPVVRRSRVSGEVISVTVPGAVTHRRKALSLVGTEPSSDESLGELIEFPLEAVG